jgi:hypothetical protein
MARRTIQNRRSAKNDPSAEIKSCLACCCEDFLRIRSHVLPACPVVLVQCEDCGTQYSTGELPWLWVSGDALARKASTR